MRKTKIMSTLMGATILAAGLGGAPAMSADITITMAAPDWPPTRFMKEHFDQTYTSPAGHTTTLDMDFIPWPSFYERVAASLTSGEQKYQMIVTDSQWLGAFVEGGYYMNLTDKIAADPELTAMAGNLSALEPVDIATVNDDLAAGRALDQGDQAQQGALAGSRVTGYEDHFTLVDAEREFGQSLLPAWKPFRDVFELNHDA